MLPQIEKMLESRQNLYIFLSRVYEREVDRKFLEDLLSKKETFLKYGSDPSLNSDIAKGFREIYSYLEGLDTDRIEEAEIELAVDYANLFLGVLYAREKKGIMHPSESVYMTSLLYQEPAEKVAKLYLDYGLVKSPNFKEPEDHVALELYFIAYLCKKTIEALKSGKLDEVMNLLKTQEEFLKEHLLKWIPKLAEDVISYAGTVFYKGIGRLTKGLLEVDIEELRTIIKEMERLNGL